jgi:hypothetical protein
MSDQRIETGADAATSRDADPGEGQGIASPAGSTDPLDPRAERNTGDVDDMAKPGTDGSPGAADGGEAGTEGASYLQQEQRRVESQQEAAPDLGGREPAGDEVARPSPAAGSAEPAPPRAEGGEVSAEPSPERRAEDPGSVGREFGDRADAAPSDDIAHPSI